MITKKWMLQYGSVPGMTVCAEVLPLCIYIYILYMYIYYYYDYDAYYYYLFRKYMSHHLKWQPTPSNCKRCFN